MTRAERDELRRLLAAELIRPWTAEPVDGDERFPDEHELVDVNGITVGRGFTKNEAALIAAAVNALPSLLDAADRAEDLEAQYDRLAVRAASLQREGAHLEAENAALRAQLATEDMHTQRLAHERRAETQRAEGHAARRRLVERYQATSDGDALERQYPRVKEELERLRRLEAAVLEWRAVGFTIPIGYQGNNEAQHPFDAVKAQAARAAAERTAKEE